MKVGLFWSSDFDRISVRYFGDRSSDGADRLTGETERCVRKDGKSCKQADDEQALGEWVGDLPGASCPE